MLLYSDRSSLQKNFFYSIHHTLYYDFEFFTAEDRESITVANPWRSEAEMLDKLQNFIKSLHYSAISQRIR